MPNKYMRNANTLIRSLVDQRRELIEQSINNTSDSHKEKLTDIQNYIDVLQRAYDDETKRDEVSSQRKIHNVSKRAPDRKSV